MPVRFSVWTAFAFGISLSGLVLGGCRTHPSPVISSLVEPAAPPKPIEVDSGDLPPAVAPPRDDVRESIRRNLQNGELEEAAGRPDQAARYYQRILHDEPHHAEANQRLARLALTARDYHQAERHLRAALKGYPASVELWTELAHCFHAQNRPDAARVAARHAQEMSRHGPQVAGLDLRTAGQVASPGIVRTVRVEPVTALDPASRPRSNDEPLLPQNSRLLPRAIIHRKLAERESPAIHMASLETSENHRPKESPPSTDYGVASDGNLPLWLP